MSIYIEADDMMRNVQQEYAQSVPYRNAFKRMIKKAKAIDIVRCRECTYKGEINCPLYYLRRELKPDDFCSYGKREG